MFFAYPGSDSLDDLLEKLKIAFAESYSVEKELLGGGMSRLFLATDLALSRTVVIKILPPELTSDMMPFVGNQPGTMRIYNDEFPDECQISFCD